MVDRGFLTHPPADKIFDYLIFFAPSFHGMLNKGMQPDTKLPSLINKARDYASFPWLLRHQISVFVPWKTRAYRSRPCQLIYYGLTRAVSTASLFSLPTKDSINSRAKSMAVPGPREVMIFPSLTTGSLFTCVVGRSILSRKPG